jgi:hypothetical protein
MSFRTVFIATAVQPQRTGAEKKEGGGGGMGMGGIKDGPSLEDDGACLVRLCGGSCVWLVGLEVWGERTPARMTQYQHMTQ